MEEGLRQIGEEVLNLKPGCQGFQGWTNLEPL